MSVRSAIQIRAKIVALVSTMVIKSHGAIVMGDTKGSSAPYRPVFAIQIHANTVVYALGLFIASLAFAEMVTREATALKGLRAATQILVNMVGIVLYTFMTLILPNASATPVTLDRSVKYRLLNASQIHANMVELA